MYTTVLKYVLSFSSVGGMMFFSYRSLKYLILFNFEFNEIVRIFSNWNVAKDRQGENKGKYEPGSRTRCWVTVWHGAPTVVLLLEESRYPYTYPCDVLYTAILWC